ncbi:MAG: hypothetical protein LC723_04825 [Actinobacteria bacterium]|nr:hypothetical protein [Actinomycetota bacterium]
MLLRGSRFATPAVAALLLLNPFVFDRILAGHFGLLLGYALLPLLFSILLRNRSFRLPGQAIRAGLLIALLIALSPHFIFIAGIAVIAVVVVSTLHHDRFIPGRIATTWLIAGPLSLYWLIPSAVSLATLDRLTPSDLKAFRSVADPHLGLFANVAGLYGFWHREWPLPKDGLPGWWAFMLAMLVVICVGAWLGLRDPERKRLSLTLLISGILGFFLALGDQGPTGSIFLWMFNHVPGFKIMREPQKFLGLLLIAYAFFYGIGSEWLVNGFRKRWLKAAMAIVLIALPCIYTYKMFWGFNGYVKPSKFPDSWAQADRLMGDGPEKALALPWHLYMAFPWTQNRLVANPMSSYFRRETIVGDNIELNDIKTQSDSPRSHYLEFMFAQGNQTEHFGNLVAPLGIKYILLSKETDWQNYRWIENQTDLRLLKEWSDLRLYENRNPVPLAYSTDRKLELADLGEVAQAANSVRLTDYAVTIGGQANGSGESPVSSQSVPLTKHSPVNYETSGPVGGRYLVFTEPYDRDWAYRGTLSAPNLGATNLFETAPRAGAHIRFLRWRLVLTGYLISGGTLLALFGFLAYDLLKRRREKRTNDLTPASWGL